MDELSLRSCRAAIVASISTSLVLRQLGASRRALAAARELLREPVFPFDERALNRRR
jgi:hypothetical protein